MLRTNRLRLIPATVDLLRADIAGPERLGAALGYQVADGWPPEFYDQAAMEWTLKHLQDDPTSEGWSLYYVIGPDDRAVGVVGYKHPPDPEGMVEIGYGIVPHYRLQGFATEAAGGLVARAFRDPRVQRVTAETLPPLVGSIRVLEQNGFRLTGEGSEPGVIRFELTRADYEAGHRAIPDHLRHFLRLLGHQAWADARVLHALEHSPTAPASTLTLFSHILGAEHVWLARLIGDRPTQAVWPELDLAQCRRLARDNELGYRTFLFGLTPDGLRRVVEYRNSAGQELQTAVEDILMQVFLHGSYHRGQIALQLRLADAVPESTDYIAFARGTPAATRQAR